MSQDNTLQGLIHTLPQTGRIEWTGLRPARRTKMNVVQQTELNTLGIIGDRYRGSSGKRAVTLIQAEYLPAIASMLDHDAIEPEILRRNIVISGINLLALKNQRFMLGSAELEMTGLCPLSHKVVIKNTDR